MSAFSGQFVPVKIVTDGNPQWSNWARRYPIDGKGIPRIYVVRADGEMLYGAVGSLPNDQLPQMLLTTLNQSGRAFNNTDAQLLQTAVADAQGALDSGDFLKASIAFSSINKLGSPDELGSYAASALQAGKLYQELQARIESDVEKAIAELNQSDNESVFTALLVLCGAEAAYKLFPKLRRKAASFTKELRKDKSNSETFAQADGLVRARSLRFTSNARIQSRAVRAYTDLMRRFPETAVDQLARAELKEIDPDAQVPDVHVSAVKTLGESSISSPSKSGFRSWTARTGKFSTKAKFIAQKEGKVQLMKADGSTIVVEISVLSDEDQRFLREQ